MTLPDIPWPLGSAEDTPPPSVAYVVRVKLHDIATWVVTNDPDLPWVFYPTDPIGVLADPLTITRSVPQSDLWPLQPDPATATFTVVTPTAADLADVKIGTRTSITYQSPPAAFSAVTEAFYGRVADVQITPGEYLVGHDEDGAPIYYAALHTITCVDYLADLEDQVRWGVDYYSLSRPTAPITYLLEDFFDQAGMGDLVFEAYDGDTTPDSPWVRVPDDNTETGVREIIETLLAQWALTGDSRGPARYVIDQNVDPTTGLPDPDQPYAMRLAFKNIDPAADDYLDAPDPAHMTVIDAAHVDLGATAYTGRKFDAIRKVITYPSPPGSAAWGVGLTRAAASLSGTPGSTVKIATGITIDSTYVGGGATGLLSDAQPWIDDLADFYLPADVPRARYAADSFTWRLYAAPEGSFLPNLGDVLAVDGISAAWTPTGLTWFTGRLTGYTLTIATKRPTIDFTLRDVAS